MHVLVLCLDKNSRQTAHEAMFVLFEMIYKIKHFGLSGCLLQSLVRNYIGAINTVVLKLFEPDTTSELMDCWIMFWFA